MVSGGQATSEMSIKSDPIFNTAVIYLQMLAKCSRLHSIGSLIIVWHCFPETKNQAGEVSQWVKHLLFQVPEFGFSESPINNRKVYNMETWDPEQAG